MNIYVYSDESGVFDKEHNDYFVFAGIILLGTESKNEWSRRYSHAESVLRKFKGVLPDYELKATNITNKEKSQLYRSLNSCYKFGIIIKEKQILDSIYSDKKTKQRFLDFAFKIAVKRAFEEFIKLDILDPATVERIYFYADEHSTATNGRYELREALEQEFKHGTFNSMYSKFFPPIFPNMKSVDLEYCNSATKLLIRSADIVANKIYYMARNNLHFNLALLENLFISYFPSE